MWEEIAEVNRKNIAALKHSLKQKLKNLQDKHGKYDVHYPDHYLYKFDFDMATFRPWKIVKNKLRSRSKLEMGTKTNNSK